MKGSKILCIIATILWLILGSIIYWNKDNKSMVLVWLCTVGIFFLLLMSLELRHLEKVDNLQKGENRRKK